MSEIKKTGLVTQEDVAKRAGVSRAIVSYVLNNGPRNVSEETRLRVLNAIEALGYRPNKHAQMLSAATDLAAENYIGIVLAGKHMFKRPYYGEMLAGIHEHVHQRGWHIRFIRLFEDFSNPALFNELIHQNEISGVILLELDQVLSTSDDRTMIEEIVRRVERVVCIDWVWPGVPSVQFDHQSVAYQATGHLLTLNKTHIAYIGPMDRRLQGYQQALWEKGITPEEGLTYFADDASSGHAACEYFLRSERQFDAICTGTDEVAIGMLNCLHQHGLRVPFDIAIASIDNIEISMYTIPSLTTVNIPKQEIGIHAVDILMSEKTQRGSSAFTITVPTELIVRESSVAP